jgi:hypothetical protein
MKESFIFYKSWGETIKELPEEYKCKVVDALIDYAFEGKNIDDLEQLVKAIVKPMCSEIDKNTEKYNKKVENLKNNSRNRTEIDTKSKRNRNEIEGDNVNDNVNVNDNKNVNDLKETPTESVSKKKTSKKESPVYFPQDELLEKTFQDYILTRKQIKAPMTDRAIELAINKLNDLSNGDNNRAVKILERSIMNGWKGLFPLDDPPNKSSGFKKAEDELHDFYAMTKDWAERSTYESTGI